MKHILKFFLMSFSKTRNKRIAGGVRYDGFIIWGNGLEHVAKIMSIIRNSGKYNIILIINKNIENMSNFVKGIYACDTTPRKHLAAKTRYLLDSPKRCIFILVENKQPNEKILGKGLFRHIECENINETKWLIRSKYNPKFKDPKKAISPLPAGVSHDHCIHATNTQSEVEYLLKYLKLRPLDFYKRNDFDYFVPWHVKYSYSQPEFTEVDMDIETICANIIGEKGEGRATKLEDTPHYKFLMGNTAPYHKYFNANFGVKLCEDHFPEAFQKLIENFDENYICENQIKHFVIIDNNNMILDGVHRACILKHRGKKKIKCIRIS